MVQLRAQPWAEIERVDTLLPQQPRRRLQRLPSTLLRNRHRRLEMIAVAGLAVGEVEARKDPTVVAEDEPRLQRRDRRPGLVTVAQERKARGSGEDVAGADSPAAAGTVENGGFQQRIEPLERKLQAGPGLERLEPVTARRRRRHGRGPVARVRRRASQGDRRRASRLYRKR